MLTHVRNRKKEVDSFTSSVIPELESFFNKSIKPPKVLLIKSAKTYAKYFLGKLKRKKFSEYELIDFYESSSAFYDEKYNRVCVPNFTRTGFCTFETHQKNNTISTQYIVHEIIHAYQYQHGGYSDFSDCFDEGCTEICSYILTGSIKDTDQSSYFDWVVMIFRLFETIGKKGEDVLQFSKEYTVSDNKDGMISELLRKYIKKHKLDMRWNGIHSIMENYNYKKLKTLPGFRDIKSEDTRRRIQNELYRLFEENRIV